MKRQFILSACLLAFGISLWGSAVQAKVTVIDTSVYTFPLDADGNLSVANVNGNIEIRGWDRDSARVTAEKRVTASRRTVAKRYLEKIKINFDSDPSNLDIEPKIPKGANGNWNFFDWIFGTGERVQARVNLLIQVPQKIYAKVENVNGRIQVKRLSGEMRVSCVNGRITFEEVTGEIYAKTVNGRIQVSISNAQQLEDLNLKTVNGSILARLPEDVGGYVDISVLNGSITTDFPLEFEGKIQRHKLQGRIGKGHARIHLHSLNGSIRLLKQEHDTE